MNKHTPKPWKPAGPLATHIIDEKGMMVADAPHFREMTPEEGFANRDLIAAAPDLLEALKYLLSQFGLKEEYVDQDARREAAAAIAKAEGKS